MSNPLIKAKADEIRYRLNNTGIPALLYGEPIDTNDPDSVLVACVLIAEVTTRHTVEKEYELALDLVKQKKISLD